MKTDFNNVEDLVVAQGGSKLSIGNLIYFTLGNLYVKNEVIEKIALESGMPKDYFKGKYHTTHAFMTATQDCLPASEPEKKYKVRVFTNEPEDFIYSRELKVEMRAKQQNPITHLANVYYDSNTGSISYNIDSNISKELFNLGYDTKDRIQNAIDRFYMIQEGISRDRLTTRIIKFIREELEASAISAHGNLYFVPIHNKNKLLALETFFDLLEKEYEKIRQKESLRLGFKKYSKRNYEDLGAHMTSIEVLNTEKYVKEYTREYYRDTKKEIELIKSKLYQLNDKDGISQRVIEGWNKKIKRLLERKQKYEDTFNTSLEDMELDFIDIEREIIALEEKNNTNSKQTKLEL